MLVALSTGHQLRSCFLSEIRSANQPDIDFFQCEPFTFYTCSELVNPGRYTHFSIVLFSTYAPFFCSGVIVHEVPSYVYVHTSIQVASLLLLLLPVLGSSSVGAPRPSQPITNQHKLLASGSSGLLFLFFFLSLESGEPHKTARILFIAKQALNC